MNDLWPEEIGTTTEISNNIPVVILMEQAELLGKRTHNVVLAEVSGPTLDDYEGGGFSYHFF